MVVCEQQANRCLQMKSVKEEQMNLDKVDGKELLLQAERTGRIFPMKASWKRMQIFAGVLC